VDCVSEPAFSLCLQRLPFVLLYLPDERSIAGVYTSGRPENHFRKDRRKIDSFRRQGVNRFSPVRGISFGGDDS
jgi:hypothetical protein